VRFDGVARRTRIGLIVPSYSTTLEPLLYRVVPHGVFFHTARLLGGPELTLARLRELDLHALRAAQEVASARPDAIAYCAPLGVAKSAEHERGLHAELELVTGIRTTTTLDAVVRGLAAVGARRVALASPYPAEIVAREVAVLEGYGLTVANVASLGILDGPALAAPEPQEIYRLGRAAFVAGADALYISGEDLRSPWAVAALEDDLGVPVVAAPLAVLWNALRLAGVRLPIAGYGRLLAAPDARPGPRGPLRPLGAADLGAPRAVCIGGQVGEGLGLLRRGRRPRVLVVGGSLAGLWAGLAMRAIGCEVTIFERSPGAMQSRGAGLAAQGVILRLLEERGIADPAAVTVPSPMNRFIDRAGRVVRDDPIKRFSISWDVLYQVLRRAYGDEGYHHDKRMVRFAQDERSVVVRFADGDEVAGDLLIGADGIGSTTRQQLFPEVEPEYAGYVAWRGLVPQEAVSPEVAARLAYNFGYYNGPGMQFLSYPVPGPGGEVEPEKRRLNWVWYYPVPAGEPLREVLTDRYGVERQLSIPQGLMREEIVAQQREIARRALPEVYYQLFVATTEPFVQTIYDLGVPRMAVGRVCLIGDAAFAPRPHAAAATAKAAVDAFALAKELRDADGDVLAALQAWEPVQLELGRNVLAYARLRGNWLVFGS
jgi:maleate cis-trans isomerase/2-polyprenyl-6-methoxyphenol hydroxylase-like FAD-dependent oxidoreductase